MTKAVKAYETELQLDPGNSREMKQEFKKVTKSREFMKIIHPAGQCIRCCKNMSKV